MQGLFFFLYSEKSFRATLCKIILELEGVGGYITRFQLRVIVARSSSCLVRELRLEEVWVAEALLRLLLLLINPVIYLPAETSCVCNVL
jgi:hypothetical protein